MDMKIIRYNRIDISKYLLCFAVSVLTLLLLTNCTRNDRGFDINGSKALSFVISEQDEVPAEVTKVTPYSSTNTLTPGRDIFGVVAYKYGTSDAPFSDWESYISTPLSVSSSSGASVWFPSSPIYFPKDEYLRIFAYAPFQCVDGNDVDIRLTEGGSAIKPQIHFEVNEDYSKQTDLLIATPGELDGNTSMNNLKVPLRFHHALVGITFKRIPNCEVQSISIEGIYDSGVLDLESGIWSNLAKKEKTYSIVNPTFNFNGSFYELEEKFTLMLLPQILPAFARLNVECTIDGNQKSYSINLDGYKWDSGKLISYIIDGNGIEEEFYFLGDPSISFIHETINDDSPVTTKIITVQSFKSGINSSVKEHLPLKFTYGLTANGPWYEYNQIPTDSELATIIDPSQDPVTMGTSPTYAKFHFTFKGNSKSAGNLVALRGRDKISETFTDLALWDPIYGNKKLGVYGKMRPGPITANCYIIRQKGKYKFPCVYGNAIDGKRGEETAYSEFDNKRAYNPFDTYPSSAEEEYVLTRFMNFKSSGTTGTIESPFIHLDPDVNPSGDANDIASNYEAVIVWQDVEASDGFLKSLEIATESMVGSKIGDVPYIKFDIDNNIQEGNVIIALRNKSTKTIVWSWHIWVTAEDDLTPQELENREYRTSSGTSGLVSKMLPVILGWNTNEAYPARELFIKITQEESNDSKIIYFLQDEAFKNGNAPYYQWGRKDPMIARNKIRESTIKTISSPEYSISDIVSENNQVTDNSAAATGIATSIKVPYKMIKNASEFAKRRNLWSGRLTTLNFDTPTIKTIYDPCPPGFCVPRRNIIAGTIEQGIDVVDMLDVYYTIKRGSADERLFRIFRGGYRKSDNGSVEDDAAFYWTASPATASNCIAFRTSTSKVVKTVSVNGVQARFIWPAVEE